MAVQGHRRGCQTQVKATVSYGNAIHNLSTKQMMRLGSPIVLVALSLPGGKHLELEILNTKPAETEA